MSRVTGVSKWKREMSDYQRRIEEEVKKIVKDNAFSMQANSKQLASVRSGYLKRKIVVRKISDYKYEVRSEAEYSIFVEFGTVYMSAQPFFFPSYYKQVQTFERDMQKLLRKAGG